MPTIDDHEEVAARYWSATRVVTAGFLIGGVSLLAYYVWCEVHPPITQGPKGLQKRYSSQRAKTELRGRRVEWWVTIRETHEHGTFGEPVIGAEHEDGTGMIVYLLESQRNKFAHLRTGETVLISGYLNYFQSWRSKWLRIHLNSGTVLDP